MCWILGIYIWNLEEEKVCLLHYGSLTRYYLNQFIWIGKNIKDELYTFNWYRTFFLFTLFVVALYKTKFGCWSFDNDFKIYKIVPNPTATHIHTFNKIHGFICLGGGTLMQSSIITSCGIVKTSPSHYLWLPSGMHL